MISFLMIPDAIYLIPVDFKLWDKIDGEKCWKPSGESIAIRIL